MNKYIKLTMSSVITIGLISSSYAQIAHTTYNQNTRDLTSAISVMTKQEGIGAQQQAESAMISSKALATAIGAINMSDRVLRFMVDDAGRLGSSQTTTCSVFAEQQAENIKILQSSINAANMVSNYMKVMMSNSVESEKDKLVRHGNYCSIAEANMGTCTLLPNGLQAADSNYSLVFSKSKLQDDTFNAATDYIANIADTRYSAQDICSNTQCMTKQIEFLNKTSGNSLAAFVLSNQVSDRLSYSLTSNSTGAN
jgi:hypothetical protein